jgi:L-amino acid N-acyltransferase YncA
MADALLIRPSTAQDIPAITAIYARHVASGTATFELDAPDPAEMVRRRDDVLGRGLPWLVGCAHGEVVGYAYASPFRLRPAYRFTLEDSIYVAADQHRQGIGRLLLTELIARSATTGARQMLAVIGDSRPESIALHGALGFTPCGLLAAAGWKFGGWRDVTLMQRRLGPGELRDAGQA